MIPFPQCAGLEGGSTFGSQLPSSQVRPQGDLVMVSPTTVSSKANVHRILKRPLTSLPDGAVPSTPESTPASL